MTSPYFQIKTFLNLTIIKNDLENTLEVNIYAFQSCTFFSLLFLLIEAKAHGELVDVHFPDNEHYIKHRNILINWRYVIPKPYNEFSGQYLVPQFNSSIHEQAS